MKLEPFGAHDTQSFLLLAGAEGWVAERWELDFLLDVFPEGCLVVRDEAGEAIGCVTALVHDHSGWIGNLIVAGKHRGQGIGERLFVGALQALQMAGVETVWLTASKMGMSLYEKHGFTRIDTIIRWVGAGRSHRDKSTAIKVNGTAPDGAVSLDARAWGDRRELLLSTVMGRGESLTGTDGFATVQPCGDRFQLGPFVAMNPQKAAELLESAQRMVPAGATTCLDAPVSNRSALLLFNRRHLRIAGTNELMYFGTRPEYRPELLYGLATMGSCG